MLSQTEIDNLMKGKIEGKSPPDGEKQNLPAFGDQDTPKPKSGKAGKSIRPYNFLSPDRLSKENMRAIEVLHEDLAERLTTSMPPYIRANLRPRVTHTEQGRFHDLMSDLDPTSLFHIVSLPPLPGQMVMTISANINFIVLEKRLGGPGEQIHTKEELTEIDLLLLSEMAEHILADIKASWKKIIPIEPKLEETTPNFNWVQMTLGNERVVLVAFEIAIQEIIGNLNIFIPFNTIKPITQSLTPHSWVVSGVRERTQNGDTHAQAMTRLARMALPLRVILGGAALTLGDLARLKSGDIIPLDTQVQQELPVQVVDRTRFLARPGCVGKNLAVQITRIVNPNE